MYDLCKKCQQLKGSVLSPMKTKPPVLILILSDHKTNEVNYKNLGQSDKSMCK